MTMNVNNTDVKVDLITWRNRPSGTVHTVSVHRGHDFVPFAKTVRLNVNYTAVSILHSPLYVDIPTNQREVESNTLSSTKYSVARSRLRLILESANQRICLPNIGFLGAVLFTLCVTFLLSLHSCLMKEYETFSFIFTFYYSYLLMEIVQMDMYVFFFSKFTGCSYSSASCTQNFSTVFPAKWLIFSAIMIYPEFWYAASFSINTIFAPFVSWIFCMKLHAWQTAKIKTRN